MQLVTYGLAGLELSHGGQEVLASVPSVTNFIPFRTRRPPRHPKVIPLERGGRSCPLNGAWWYSSSCFDFDRVPWAPIGAFPAERNGRTVLRSGRNWPA